MSKKTVRRKHIPQRTCIACKEILAKRSLIRIVRTKDGVKIDPTGKLPGRGAYVHVSPSCWERALKGPLAGALKMEFSDTDREQLMAMMASYLDESPRSSQELASLKLI